MVIENMKNVEKKESRIVPFTKGQKVYKIKSIKDFLNTDMKDDDMVLAIIVWGEVKGNIKKFYGEYNGPVFRKSTQILYTPIRNFVRIAESEKDIIDFAHKWADCLGTNDDYNNIPRHILVRILANYEGKTFTVAKFRNIFFHDHGWYVIENKDNRSVAIVADDKKTIKVRKVPIVDGKVIFIE